jgi:hypothetical protein
LPGGGGGGNPSYGQTDGEDGIVEETNGNTGSAGNGGGASSYNGGGAGFTGNGAVKNGTTAANSFTNGGTGGNPNGHATQSVGGFGGGGTGRLLPGGGGGYSGGKTTGSWSGSGSAFGGGSFNSGANQDNMAGDNEGHGRVLIALGTVSFDNPKTLMNSNWTATEMGRLYLMQKLGYRFATSAEVTKAREAATPGAVNNWTASNQVKPRNLPGKVNEYGFDVSTTSGFWVIKE